MLSCSLPVFTDLVHTGRHQMAALPPYPRTSCQLIRNVSDNIL
jgi:hypothetical protein